MEKQYCPYCMTLTMPGEPCPNCGRTGGAYTAQPHQLPPGTMLAGRYLLGRVLGEGGFGITYIGWDTRLKLRVAVKEYYPVNHVSRNCRVSTAVSCFSGAAGQRYESGRERFIQEAQAMARMDKSPQIVAVRDYFLENNTAYIVMEYVDGTTFKALVARKGGRIPAGELLAMVEPLFGALEAMHALGLIHRDISPDNLMLENGMVRLLDFGCARESAAQGNETLTIVLKQGYSPVEQYQHKGQGPWTDVYSLAATMYYCLTGVAPPQALDRICDDELVPPRKLGADLTEAQEQALLFGMGLQPNRRFRSVREFHASLYLGAPVPAKPQNLYGPDGGRESVPREEPGNWAAVQDKVEEKSDNSSDTAMQMEENDQRSPVTSPRMEPAPEPEEQAPLSGGAPTADTPWHFPPVPDSLLEDSSVKRRGKKPWLPIAATCGAAAVLAIVMALALGPGGSAGPGPGTSAPSQSQAVSQPTRNPEKLLTISGGDAAGNGAALAAALEDGGVTGVLIFAGTYVEASELPVINKPVTMEAGTSLFCPGLTLTVGPDGSLVTGGFMAVGDLIVQGRMEAASGADVDVWNRTDIPGGQLTVDCEMRVCSLLTVSDGGHVTVEKDGHLHATAYFLESRESLTALGDSGAYNGVTAVADIDGLFDGAVHVETSEELRAAVNNGEKAIVLDGIITDRVYLRTDAAILISENGGIVYPFDYDGQGSYVEADVLVNRGRIVGSVFAQYFFNYGEAEVDIYDTGTEGHCYLNFGQLSTHAVSLDGLMVNLGTLTQLGYPDRPYSFILSSGQFLNGEGASITVKEQTGISLGDPGSFYASMYNYGSIRVEAGGRINLYAPMCCYRDGLIQLEGVLDNNGTLELEHSAGLVLGTAGQVTGSGIVITDPSGGSLAQDGRISCSVLMTRVPGGGPAVEAATLEQLQTASRSGAAGQIHIPTGTVIEVGEDLALDTPLVLDGQLRMAPGTTLTVNSVVQIHGQLTADHLVVCRDAQLFKSGDISLHPQGVIQFQDGSTGILLAGILAMNGGVLEVAGENTQLALGAVNQCEALVARAGKVVCSGWGINSVELHDSASLTVWGGIEIQDGRQLLVDGSAANIVGHFNLNSGSGLILENGAEVYHSCANVDLQSGSRVEIRSGYLELWHWSWKGLRVDADVVNGGSLRFGGGGDLGGHIVNNGEIYIYGADGEPVRLQGLLENNGVIYLEDRSASLVTSGDGQYTGGDPVYR